MKKITLLAALFCCSFTLFAQTTCTPISTLNCEDLVVDLPFTLDFSTSVENSLVDNSGNGIGFTAVMEHSEERRIDAGDLVISNPNTNGYEPSLIEKKSNSLEIRSQAGIAFRKPGGTSNSNNQINTLGAGLGEFQQPIHIKSTLLNVVTGSGSAQAGLWFGFDEDNFVKLCVVDSSIELRVESDGFSGNGPRSGDQVISNLGASGKDVALDLIIDPNELMAEAYYTIGSGARLLLGSLAIPANYITGRSIGISGNQENITFAGIYATHRNGSQFTASFDNFSIEEAEERPLALEFDQSELTFAGTSNETLAPKSINLAASSGNPLIILSDDPDASSWLIVPSNPRLGELEFGIKPNLAPGSYRTTIIAQDQPDMGYANAEVVISLTINESPSDFEAKINFSNAASQPPNDYINDLGLGFSDRGNGYNYGWLAINTSSPLDVSANARNRNVSGVSQLNNTLIHMQYGDVSNGNNGVSTEGIWEIEVPNGSYNITVGVGDPTIDSNQNDIPSHVINAEGVRIIAPFTPSGAIGSAERFKSESKIVAVRDGKLTIDAQGGHNTKINYIEIVASTGTSENPMVLGVMPSNNAFNVPVNTSISANNLYLPNFDENGITGVNNSTITNATVRLFKEGSTTPIGSSANGTGGGDAINLVPNLPLEENTKYIFEIDGVEDTTGRRFNFFTSSFTTGGSTTGPSTELDNVSFTRTGAVGSSGQFTTLTFGPDGKLYALQINGAINRYEVASDGSLINEEILQEWKANYTARAAIGLAFDPNATATNLIAYISHQSGALGNAPDWDGKISRISGQNLEQEELLVTNLPRSLRDHLTNSIAFNPAEPNVLYFNQGSNSAAGAPDSAWGNREESLLSAATLRLDLVKLPSELPLDVKTTRNIQAIINVNVNSPNLDGLYNPYYVNAPLTLYATGIRNAYDLVWHTNGQLYIPTNGTAGRSNAPASIEGMRRPDGSFYDYTNPRYPEIPASNDNNTQRDWLFRIDPNSSIGYYGHPNPFRGEFVLNRGEQDVINATAGADGGAAYEGVVADFNYRGAAFDFEFNKSPNGVIEYRSLSENGNLQGVLLVARYSGGSDIIALVPNGLNGDILTSKTGIPGFGNFQDPLDLVEDVRNGNIYVSDFRSREIILLKPNNSTVQEPNITVNTEQVTGDAVINSGTYEQELTISNLGNGLLSNITAQITGAANEQFSIVGLPSSINPQNSSSFQVRFTPTAVGPQYANLVINGTNAEPFTIQLNGLGKRGLGGTNEPSLQWIIDTKLGEDVVNVGDTDATSNIINLPNGSSYNSLLGDEVAAQQFEKASEAPISVEVLSVFGPTQNNPVVAFGWYNGADTSAINELFTVTNTPNTNGQTLSPLVTGDTEFDPGDNYFGFYSRWPFFNNRMLYSKDELNTFDGAIPHHVRVYELPGEENAYILATEEHTSGFDYQDIVVIVRNIRPYTRSETGALLAIENMTKVPGTNRGFPKENYFTFHRIGAEPSRSVHDTNIMRLNNTGTADLVVSALEFENSNQYSFELFDVTGNLIDFPITILPDSYADVKLKFIGTTPNNAMGTIAQQVRVVSNADNVSANVATLHGAFSQRSQGNNEITAQQVIDAFGFRTSMLSMVNDQGTIVPPNSVPYRPSSNFPTAANVNAGYEGDLIIAGAFVQANPDKPVIGIQLSALHGPSSDGAKFLELNSSTVVGGINFNHDSAWFQTLLPKRGAEINFDKAESITKAFRIAIQNYPTTGGNNLSGNRETLLGARVFKVVDNDGKIVPNEYIVLQDYVANGCGAGSANCDWNDNSFYFINIRPQEIPTASAIDDLVVRTEETFEQEINSFFDRGYPGNILKITASHSDGALPDWMIFNAETGILQGTPPEGTNGNFVINFIAEDANEIQVSTSLTIIINQAPIAVDDTAVTEQNTSINLDQLLGNDSDPDGDRVTITTIDTPLNGTAVLNSEGTEIVYTPNTDFVGLDQFNYTIEDESGLSASAKVEIRVIEENQAPVATISTNTIQGPAALIVRFTGSESTDDNDAITSYVWNFGDNQGTSTQADTEYVYNSVGVYDVSLTVTDNFGLTNTTRVTIMVTGQNNTAPNAVASATKVGGSQSLEFNFDGSRSTDDSDNIVSYLWDFGDGNTSNEISPNYRYAVVGTYTVTLTVTDNGNLTNSKTLQVVAGQPNTDNFALRINAGGPQLEHNGEIYLADQSFEGGYSFKNTRAEVAQLYQTERTSESAFDYTIPLENRIYSVTLHFADIYWGAQGGASGGIGKRVFDVSIEGNLVLDDYDINADVGPQTVVTKTYEVMVVDGVLNMNFNTEGSDGVDQPKLSAIEILSVSNDCALPAPWVNADIGNVAIEGSTCYQNGEFNVSAGGTDIWGNSDEFHFVYQSLTGDGEIIAQITSLEQSNDWAKATVMMRNDLEANSALAMMSVSPNPNSVGGVGYSFQKRETKGQTMGQSDFTRPVLIPDGFPYYLRLVRSGETFTGYVSQTAGNWNEVGATTIAMNETIYVGLATTSHDTDISTNAVYKNVRVIKDTETNQAPVAIASANVVSGEAPLAVRFDASSSTDDKAVTSYSWNFKDGATATQENPLHTFTQPGTYDVSLVVSDAEGLTATTTIAINVTEPSTNNFALRINTGGDEIQYRGKTFIADDYFSSGTVLDRPQTGLADPFKTFRFSRSKQMSYDIPVPDGEYTVNLYFAELWFGATGGGAGEIGNRVFDVRIEGELAEDDLDVFKEVGAQAMLVKTHTVRVTGGELNIDFDSNEVVNGERHPIINGIEILGRDMQLTPIANAGASQEIQLPTNSVLLIGSGSDPDGGVVSYLWTQISGPSIADLEGKTTPNLEASSLEVGSYVFRLTVTDDEGQTALDEVTVTVEPANDNPNEIWLEAECAIVGSLWTNIDNATVSGGQYVQSPEGNNYTIAPEDEDSRIRFNFTAQEGSYKLFARVNTPTGDNDSFWVRVNNGPWLQWNYILGGGFNWRQLHKNAERGVFVMLDLNEGANTIDFAHREEGAGLDKIYLTKTKNAPSTFGSMDTSCFTAETSVSNFLAAKINQVQVLPNPASYKMNVRLSNSSLELNEVLIFNLAGQLIKTFDISKPNIGAGIYQFDISMLENGLYLVSIATDDGTRSRHKLLIKK